jgi:hypothetical protein
MRNQTDFGKLIAVIGFVVLIGEGVAHGQIDGAVQYPPLSIGADTQPPSLAKMVPSRRGKSNSALAGRARDRRPLRTAQPLRPGASAGFAAPGKGGKRGALHLGEAVQPHPAGRQLRGLQGVDSRHIVAPVGRLNRGGVAHIGRDVGRAPADTAAMV